MSSKRTAAAALASGAALLLATGGAALATHADARRAHRCQERLARIAETRGVTVDELRATFRARRAARVDAALTAGRISPERAAVLTERIAKDEICRRTGVAIRAKGGLLRAAARYLELSRSELREQLPGTSLQALAAKQGRSVDGLEAAMLAPARAQLAKAVESGRSTRSRADRALARLEALVGRLVTRTFPAR